MPELTEIQAEAIASADAHLNNAVLPLYSEVVAALEALVANPRPAMESKLGWQERYARYSEAYDRAMRLVAAAKAECRQELINRIARAA